MTGTMHGTARRAREPWQVNLERNADSRLDGPRGDWWFTGPFPAPGRCPGVGADGVITSLPMPDLATCDRRTALDYFDNTWALCEVLFAGLRTAEAFYRPPDHELRHPMIFYYGHPAALYVNKLRVAGLVGLPVNAHFEDLLETGVDEMSWDDLSKNDRQWPSVAEVHDYRATVYRLVREVIGRTDFAADLGRPVTMDDRAWALFLAFEHDRIHLETSSVLIREKPGRLVARHPVWPAPHRACPPDCDDEDVEDVVLGEFVDVPAGAVVVGKPREVPSFGWDNEYGRHEARVPAFTVGRRLVSNARFAEFVLAGGYRKPHWWTTEGWGWRSFRNAKWPRFWVQDGPAGLHTYRLRTTFDEVAMRWDWPVCVNHHEAQAYCAWRAERDGRPYRLPFEVEHHRLRDDPARDPVMEHASAGMRELGVNLNLAFGSETPVHASPMSAAGCHDVFGNVWQWCEDAFHPLPGFAVHPYYEDFSTPCFDDEHRMILGGSFVSTGDEASVWARFHFRPHFLQHSGFRLVVGDEPDGGTGHPVYESAAALAQYLLLHFGTVRETLDTDAHPLAHAHGFPRATARTMVETARTHGVALRRVLDLGCAVGGAAFELSADVDDVVAVDNSTRLLDAARAIARDGELTYRRTDCGERTTEMVARPAPTARPDRVRFVRADATRLPEELEVFDGVLLANLLCRLPDPRACLAQLVGPRSVLRPGGLLVIATPWSWTEEHTPRTAWLGGTADGATPEQALREILAPEYTPLATHELAAVLREHARRFQYVRSSVTVWRRR